MSVQFAKTSAKSVPVYFATRDNWSDLRKSLPESARAMAERQGFEAAPAQVLLVQTDGKPGFLAVFGAPDGQNGSHADGLSYGKLVEALPAGDYHFANEPPGGAAALEMAATAWLLAAYSFDRYRSKPKPFAQLAAPKGIDTARVLRLADSIHLARDLINTPANDLGVPALTAAALQVARKYKAKTSVIKGDQLLKKNFPLIHAVGRAGADAPALIDIQWGRARAPKVTLVGKGVCFDTGGLDLKPASAMLMMKKDMGGAAVALAVAKAVMDGKLDVRLRLLLPVVENSVAGNAFRPGDVYKSRKGLTVEIGNTDAEGRLVLADALALGDDDAPEYMFDFATLTGAARVATGPDLPSFFCDDDATAEAMTKCGLEISDPVWRMPLWKPYEAMLASKVADTNNVSSGPFAGAITAALFLQKFAGKAKTWGHFDLYGWTPAGKTGRPEGAEGQCVRLVYKFLEDRFGPKS
ncbi:MAG: leucyl aminopeptidase family protein [Hyphomicrobiales bacterium]|nr:leucyl aminopeptidase family protein [Hyphomicrobiales bacterium]